MSTGFDVKDICGILYIILAINRGRYMEEKKRPGRAKDDPPKAKLTHYLPVEVKKKFNKLYAMQVLSESKENRSDLVVRAINMLYDSVFAENQRKET